MQYDCYQINRSGTTAMITTKGQRNKLYNSETGCGWLVFNSGNGEVTEIEVYVSRDNKVRRVTNGALLLPITICDKEEGIIQVN